MFICRREEAANAPKYEFVPKTLADLHIDVLPEGLNGANSFKKPPPYSQNPIPPYCPTNDANNRASSQKIGWNVPPVKRKSRKFVSFTRPVVEDFVLTKCPAFFDLNVCLVLSAYPDFSFLTFH